MIAQEKLTDEQFELEALDVIKREFGVDGLVRYLRLHYRGTGDYTRDRHKWQKDLTVEQIAEQIMARRERSG